MITRATLEIKIWRTTTMKNNETFKMTYSAEQQEEINQIRNKYVPKKQDKMAQLRALDSKATKKASSLSITVGSIGAIIMGIGMSLTMSDFGQILGSIAFPVGIVIGIIGIAILICAYPVYNRTLKEEREKIAPEVLRLTDELVK